MTDSESQESDQYGTWSRRKVQRSYVHIFHEQNKHLAVTCEHRYLMLVYESSFGESKWFQIWIYSCPNHALLMLLSALNARGSVSRKQNWNCLLPSSSTMCGVGYLLFDIPSSSFWRKPISLRVANMGNKSWTIHAAFFPAGWPAKIWEKRSDSCATILTGVPFRGKLIYRGCLSFIFWKTLGEICLASIIETNVFVVGVETDDLWEVEADLGVTYLRDRTSIYNAIFL